MDTETMAELLLAFFVVVVGWGKEHICMVGMQSGWRASEVSSLAFEVLQRSTMSEDTRHMVPFQLNLRMPEECSPPSMDPSRLLHMAMRWQCADVCLSFFGSGTRPEWTKGKKNKLTSRVNHKR
jgi:hypothetical protein